MWILDYFHPYFDNLKDCCHELWHLFFGDTERADIGHDEMHKVLQRTLANLTPELSTEPNFPSKLIHQSLPWWCKCCPLQWIPIYSLGRNGRWSRADWWCGVGGCEQWWCRWCQCWRYGWRWGACYQLHIRWTLSIPKPMLPGPMPTVPVPLCIVQALLLSQPNAGSKECNSFGQSPHRIFF